MTDFMKEQETGTGCNKTKRKQGREREKGQGRAGDSAPAELVLDAGGGMQRPPCLTYSEDTIADSAARRNPVRVDVAVPGNLEERSPVRADCEGKQAIPLAALRVGDEGEHGLFEA